MLNTAPIHTVLSASLLIRASVSWVRGQPHSFQQDLILIYILVTSTNTVSSKVTSPDARGYDFSMSLEGHDIPRDKCFQQC